MPLLVDYYSVPFSNIINIKNIFYLPTQHKPTKLVFLLLLFLLNLMIDLT